MPEVEVRIPLHEDKPLKIDMHPVSSSNIAKIGYDSDAKTLYVLFHSEALYTYYEVPMRTAVGIIEAESVGTYFHDHVRDRYDYAKVPKAPKWMMKEMPDRRSAEPKAGKKNKK